MKHSRVRAACILTLVLGLLAGCAVPRSCAYKALYAHLDVPPAATDPLCESQYFLVVLVEARHLDYTDNASFLKTVAKHPSDGSKNRDVGHAWIYLQGIIDGQSVFLEGGHSGELGLVQARYFDGIMNNIEYGAANPSQQQCQNPSLEPNPVKYLWETQHDGFFQCGAGRHFPTFAAKIDLSREQFDRMMAFIKSYRYSEYAITGSQCSSFAAQVASLGGLELACEVTMEIEPCINVGGAKLPLWRDPSYAQLTISSPDILERSLMQAVREGRAEGALAWYKKRSSQI